MIVSNISVKMDKSDTDSVTSVDTMKESTAGLTLTRAYSITSEPPPVSCFFCNDIKSLLVTNFPFDLRPTRNLLPILSALLVSLLALLLLLRLSWA